ncbi:unnamed protein product [Caenorhabditis sp. 36 PRJEB53466]|nr:unnamed protein product [Caenorhabditis sp. 36 PRJEB53466]
MNKDIELSAAETSTDLPLRAVRTGLGALLANLRETSSEHDRSLKEEKETNVRSKVPTTLKTVFCDQLSYNSHEATFGYKSTRTNNFIHISIQNEKSTSAVTASQDRCLRVYKMGPDDAEQIWKQNTGGLILDVIYGQNEQDILTTSKMRPIQLWDIQTGHIVGTYNGKDAGDNIQEAMCIGQTGNKLVGGFKNNFQMWDISIPGRAISTFKSFDSGYNTGVTAAGTSSRVGIYSVQWKSAVSTMEGSNRGYTNIKFSSSGQKLYASERSGDIHCFDTRMNAIVQVLKRNMQTSHRSRFDISEDDKLLFSGTSTGQRLFPDAFFDHEEYRKMDGSEDVYQDNSFQVFEIH